MQGKGSYFVKGDSEIDQIAVVDAMVVVQGLDKPNTFKTCKAL